PCSRPIKSRSNNSCSISLLTPIEFFLRLLLIFQVFFVLAIVGISFYPLLWLSRWIQEKRRVDIELPAPGLGARLHGPRRADIQAEVRAAEREPPVEQAVQVVIQPDGHVGIDGRRLLVGKHQVLTRAVGITRNVL